MRSEKVKSASAETSRVNGEGVQMIPVGTRFELRQVVIIGTWYDQAPWRWLFLKNGDSTSSDDRFSYVPTNTVYSLFNTGTSHDVINIPGRGILYDDGLYFTWVFTGSLLGQYRLTVLYS